MFVIFTDQGHISDVIIWGESSQTSETASLFLVEDFQELTSLGSKKKDIPQGREDNAATCLLKAEPDSQLTSTVCFAQNKICASTTRVHTMNVFFTSEIL